MSAIVEVVCSGEDALPVRLCPWEENSYGLVSLWEMLQFGAGRFVDLLGCMSRLENQLAASQAVGDLDFENVGLLGGLCEDLGLPNSGTQANRVRLQYQHNFSHQELLTNLRELLRRITDELFGVCFYYVLPNKAGLITRPEKRPSVFPLQVRLKFAYEYFGPKITQRFPSLDTDLREAIKCYAYECLPACVFHLMRATEVGIFRIAKLCEIKDARPNWNSVLKQAEDLTQRTKHKDIPAATQPHREFLKTIVADMRSLEHAWRNKIMHSEDKLIPSCAEFDSQDIHMIFTATHSFLLHLAEGLPDGC
jgi:hypothetical protein